MKAADEFKNKTIAPNQLWQTDFTYLKVTGWGWFDPVNDPRRLLALIIAWKLCTTMKADERGNGHRRRPSNQGSPPTRPHVRKLRPFS